MSDEKNLYNPHDGLTGRDGGPYLDQEERRLAEIVRASREGRKPDFENAPATAGTPLVTAATLVAIANPASNPSMLANDPIAGAVDKLSADESFPVNSFATRATTQEEKDAEEAAKNPQANPADPTVIGTDTVFGGDEDAKSDKPSAKPTAARTSAPSKTAADSKPTAKKAAAKTAAK